MIYVTIDTAWEFEDVFKEYGRGTQFSHEGFVFLFEYYSEFCSTDMELDPIAICSDWAEYDSLEQARKDYEDIEDRLQDTAWELPGGSVMILQI